MDSPIHLRVASQKIIHQHHAKTIFHPGIHLKRVSPSSKKMRILTRYILREVTSHALLGGALFTFIIFTRDLAKILEFLFRASASYSDVARIIAYPLPTA